jgi:3-oxoacyl-[acyl-carrier protein] reductase
MHNGASTDSTQPKDETVEREAHPVPVYPDLAGRVAVVTGGSKGIGAATSRMLAANGVKVAVNARAQDAIDVLVDELRASGTEAIGVAADVTRREEIERVRRAAEDALGPVDILLPFAGGFSSYTPVHEIEEDEWRSILDWNLTSTFLTMNAFLPGMIERRRGAIVTMASNTARFLDILTTASYAAAKAGVIMLTRHAAIELGTYGIRVNCIAPATTLTERVAGIMSEERQAEVGAMSPLGRLGTPEDSAAATLFLVSDSASWLTGLTLDVAGGRIML